MNKIEIDSTDKIDINNNAVIEASAGTGKTHAIVNLSVKIILEKKIRPDEMIIVTFTEKAAGELKERIRKKFEENNNTQNEFIKEIFENIESLNISTIHGFCNKLLTEYSFENRQPFEKELEDDKNIIDKILNEVMMNDWKNHYKDNLKMMIELSDFIDKPESFLKTIKEVSLNYKKYNDDVLLPDLLEYEDLIKTIDDFDNQIDNLKKNAGTINTGQIENHKFIVHYNSLDINGNKRRARIKNILIPLLNFIDECNSENISKCKAYKSFYEISSNLTGFDVDQYLLLFTGFNSKSWDYDYKIKIPELYETALILNKLFGLYIKLKDQLTVYTINNLISSIEKFKTENNLTSYEDMLKNLKISIDSNPDFLKTLQSRFKYALIDEFQDTDKTQWYIFKSIFLDNPSNRLFVVGDPKQSIYRFRNADVNTYYSAKEKILNEFKGNLYFLNTCYRASAQLVDDLNNFFSGDLFDKSFSEKLDYSIVKSVNNKIFSTYIKINDIRDKSGILFFDLKSLNKINALKELGSCIVNEIKYLLNNKNNIKLKIKNEEERNLKENDICILARNKTDAEYIQNALSLVNIKSMFYKKSGLYGTDEAINLKFIINSLSNPEDINAFKKALLTDFFGIDIKSLNNYIELDPSHPIKILYGKWIKLSQKNEWSGLFHSIIYESGLIYRLTGGDKDSERAITNYKHITEKLSETAAVKKYNIFDLNIYYNNIIKNNIKIDIDDNLHRLETEDNKVVIMTIHASKGLEFPIVFDYSILNINNKTDYYKYYDNNNIVYDIAKNKDNKDKHANEEENDNYRLKYVALTRPMVKLYLFFYQPQREKSLSKTTELVNESITRNNFQVVDNKNLDTEVVKANKKPQLENSGYDLSGIFKEIKKDFFVSKKLTLQSFSSINRFKKLQEKTLNIKPDFSDNEKENDDNLKENLMQSKIDLPGGTGTGLMFHKIFEEIDFEAVNKFKNTDYKHLLKEHSINILVDKYFNIYLKQQVKSNDEEFLYKDKIYNIIFNTLNTEIITNFCLSDLKQNNILKEIEFYYPVNQKKSNIINSNINLEAFMNGFIDMVFRCDDKYYLLDWKSNIIENGYSGESFHNEVKSHYEAQYKIYYYAFIKWLNIKIKNFDYKRQFGGIFYIYLRGIGQDKNDPNCGIHFVNYDIRQSDAIKAELSDIITIMNCKM